MRPVDSRVGIDKKQDLSLRRVCAGVAGGGDLAAIDRHDPGTGAGGDFGCSVGRRIIYHDYFVGLLRPGATGAMDCCDGRRQLHLFVVSRDDERNHGVII